MSKSPKFDPQELENLDTSDLDTEEYSVDIEDQGEEEDQ